MFSRPKILFLVSLLFVALLNPKFNPYLLFKFLIFYHSSINNNSSEIKASVAIKYAIACEGTGYPSNWPWLHRETF